MDVSIVLFYMAPLIVEKGMAMMETKTACNIIVYTVFDGYYVWNPHFYHEGSLLFFKQALSLIQSLPSWLLSTHLGHIHRVLLLVDSSSFYWTWIISSHFCPTTGLFSFAWEMVLPSFPLFEASFFQYCQPCLSLSQETRRAIQLHSLSLPCPPFFLMQALSHLACHTGARTQLLLEGKRKRQKSSMGNWDGGRAAAVEEGSSRSRNVGQQMWQMCRCLSLFHRPRPSYC